MKDNLKRQCAITRQAFRRITSNIVTAGVKQGTHGAENFREEIVKIRKAVYEGYRKAYYNGYKICGSC